MKIPILWLKDYLHNNVELDNIAHKLTMAGLESEIQITKTGTWSGILVGEILDIEKHPNADRLNLVTVDLNDEIKKVVCGAPNVKINQKIAFAKVGSELLDQESNKLVPLQAAKIRGVVSEGMICSEKELGIGEDHNGILVLPPKVLKGTKLETILGQEILETEPTPNRPDWLSVIGVAREIAALNNSVIKEPNLEYTENDKGINTQASISIKDKDLCGRYTASVISGIKIEESPDWLKTKLINAGQRPINNIVDITNYVMLEIGQPLHAFDLSKIKNSSIKVRRAKNNEVLVTLDDEKRILSNDMLVIADDEKPIGLAGIMGGLDSGVTENTTTILLESASFLPANIRKTRTELKMRTEASHRFERHLNPELAIMGQKRAISLIQEITKGTVYKNIIDIYPGEIQTKSIQITTQKVSKVLGIQFTLNQMEKIFSSLGIQSNSINKTTLEIIPPYWRSDINIVEDLIEELARIRGYEVIPTKYISQPIPPKVEQPERDLSLKLQDLLVLSGMQEIITYPLTSKEALSFVANKPKIEPMKLSNPMSQKPENFTYSNISDTLGFREYLRTNLRVGILESIAHNVRFGADNLKLFEVGKQYIPQENDLPQEIGIAIGGICGNRSQLNWTDDQNTMDFFDAKGIIEAIFKELKLDIIFTPKNDSLFENEICSAIIIKGTEVGVLGQVKNEIAKSFGINIKPVIIFELNLQKLLPLTINVLQYFTKLPRFPISYRDIALLVDNQISASNLIKSIKEHRLVINVDLFDEFVGKSLPDNHRSLAFRVHFYDQDHTLTSDEINESVEKILNKLHHTTGATIRETS